MLFDVTYGEPKLVTPESIKGSKYYKALERKSNPKTFSKVLGTIETAVEDLVSKGSSKLVWTKTGALLGHRSQAPHRDVNHLWESVEAVMGDGKTLLMTVGVLVLHAIASRNETHWLVYRSDSDIVDRDTGKTIKIANYWIDSNFQLPTTKN